MYIHDEIQKLKPLLWNFFHELALGQMLIGAGLGVLVVELFSQYVFNLPYELWKMVTAGMFLIIGIIMRVWQYKLESKQR